jgi:carbonic anhydrase/acetyltransferase-like protein (isoleucine patch superfamily)
MKYKIRRDLKLELPRVTLYRIERCCDGELGGYIEKESNLSQISDNAWVHGNARVYDNARVWGNARVYGNARVWGDARVYDNARVFDNARVSGTVQVYDSAWLYTNARVYGGAQVCGNAQVAKDARVYGDAQVCGDARVSGNARVEGRGHIVNFVVKDLFSITVTPDNIVIGCTLKKRSEWLKVTEVEAIAMGLPKDFYPRYRKLVKAGMKLVPNRKTINKEKK